jgi:hypothetical protein
VSNGSTYHIAPRDLLETFQLWNGSMWMLLRPTVEDKEKSCTIFFECTPGWWLGDVADHPILSSFGSRPIMVKEYLKTGLHPVLF